jgi:hypothetical protein
MLICGIDPNPPKVNDTRSLEIGATFAGLYGEAYGTVTLDVRNEVIGAHGRFYDFDAPLATYPDFDNLLPDVELFDARMSMMDTVEPWYGLPSSMADTFAAVYEFDWVGSWLGPGAYTFKLGLTGAARLFVNDELLMDVTNLYVSAIFNSPEVDIGASEQVRIRIEYYHNTGFASLNLMVTGFVPPYYSINQQLNLEYGASAKSVVPAHVPLDVDVTGPTQTVWTAPADIPVEVNASHPDGFAAVAYYVDGLKAAAITNAPYAETLANLPVNAELAVRVEDAFGFGVRSNMAVSIERQALGDWLAAHGLSDPDADDDEDGVPNSVEYAADTVPTNRLSAFRVVSVEPHGSSNLVTWTGTGSGLVLDYYTIKGAQSLTGNWNTVEGPVTVGAVSNTIWVPSGGEQYFRVEAEPR